MAGYDPNQPRDEEGKWTKAEYAARAASGVSITPIIDEYLSGLQKLGHKNPTYQFGKACPVDPNRSLAAGNYRGQAKKCYANAWDLAMGNPLEYTYVEGFAVPEGIGIPLEHAWVIDRQGFVVDNTWDGGVEYFGIPMKLSAVTEIIMEKETYGVLTWDSSAIRYFVDTGKLPENLRKK